VGGGIENGVYIHNKSGKLYEVIGTALHTETDEKLVVYKPLYPSEYNMFVRPLGMFVEQILINGLKVQRFTKQENE
jgi:hypothetical protein